MKKILLLLLGCLFGSGFAQEKISGLAAFQARHWVLDNDDFLRIYIQIPHNQFTRNIRIDAFKERFKAYYRVKEDLADNPNWLANGAEIKWEEAYLQVDNQYIKFLFNLAKSERSPTGILVLDLVDLKTSQKHQIVFKVAFAKTKIREEFAIFKANEDFPLIDGFVEEGESFQVSNLKKTNIDLFVTRIRQDYPAAAAPMNLSQLAQSKTLQVDTTYPIKSNEFISIAEKGLYLIRQDTNAFYGIGLRVEPPHYPAIRSKEQLPQALHYIAQKQEIQQIEKAEDLKKAIDRFWLSLFKGNVSRTREALKNYYTRVRNSNQWYASFKEGWKTDMGMIYIVFGEPDEIVWEKDSQKWIYRGNETQSYANDKGRNFSKVIFTFYRRPNQFFEDYYVLLRYIEYENVWGSMVQAIRQGIAF
ncbi:MAG: hypothetical protein OHK0045_09690 [Raineya sp.]